MTPTPTPPTPPRLAIYLPDFHGGGVERISLMLIESFVARGLDVTVVVHLRSGELNALLPPATRVVSLGVRRSLHALPRLTAYLRREAPDVLLSNLGHNNIIALWARMAARATSRCRTRVIVCQHNALSAEASALGSWQHRALPRLYAWFGRQANAIVGVSHGVSRDLAFATGLPPSRIVTIHNPVLGPRFQAQLAEPSAHPWLQDASLAVIVGIGRLVPQKDFGTLIAAFALLDRPATRLLILGDGPERAKLLQAAEALGVADRVDLAGFELNPLPTLRDAAVMALSSIYEGFGNVLVEALAAGVPVVSTHCPYGPAEILAEGRFGELVPVRDPAALAAALARQLDDPQPSPSLRRERANDFHVDVVVERYLDLLLERRPLPTSADEPAPQGATARGIFVYLPTLKVGGAELSLLQLAEGFVRRGRRVTLVVHDAGPDALEPPAGVDVLALGTKRSLFAVLHLARLLRRHRPGVLLSAFPHSNIVAVTARALAAIDCRVVISEHAPLTRHYRRMGGWRYRVLPPLVRWIYPRADGIVSVSRGVQADMATMMQGLRSQVIHNPVLPADWAERAAAPSGHRWLEDEALDVVLSVSRLSGEKDVPTLVRGFAAAAAARPNARLLIAGEGPERSAIDACVRSLGLESRVELAGLVRNPLAWMRRARVFVLASRYEGFGNVLVEALAAGTRVISTDCPVGPREILQDGRWGRLVPVGDVAALGDAIRETLQQDADSAARGVASAEAAARFSADIACDSYLQLMDSAARPNSARRIDRAGRDDERHA